MLAAVDVSSFTQKSRRGFHSRKPGKDKTNSCQCIRVEAAAYGLQIKHTDGQHVGWEVCEWWTLAVETQTGDLWVTRIIQKQTLPTQWCHDQHFPQGIEISNGRTKHTRNHHAYCLNWPPDKQNTSFLRVGVRANQISNINRPTWLWCKRRIRKRY